MYKLAIEYESFGNTERGALITRHNGLAVVYSRTRENLVLVDQGEAIWSGTAIRHGNVATLVAVFANMPKRKYRRVRRFLAERGKCLDWVLTAE